MVFGPKISNIGLMDLGFIRKIYRMDKKIG